MKPGLFSIFPNQCFLDLYPYQYGYCENDSDAFLVLPQEIIIYFIMLFQALAVYMHLMQLEKSIFIQLKADRDF